MAQNCSSFRKLEAIAEPQTAEILREENNIFGTVEDLQLLFQISTHRSAIQNLKILLYHAGIGMVKFLMQFVW